MPRNVSPAPTTRTTRRSGGVHQFLSLDLYSKGSFEKALTCYSPDENHNGIKVEPVSPAATMAQTSIASSSKRRSGRSVSSSQNNGSVKRPKRSSSSQSSTGSWSRATTPVRAAPPPAKRGRPAAGGGKATPAKATPAKRGKSAGPKKTPKKAAPKTPKKQPAVVIKQELISDDEQEQEEEVEPMVPRTRGRPRKSASDADVLTRARSELTLGGDESGVEAQLRAALDAITADSNPHLSPARREEAVTHLGEVVHAATAMTGACYDTVIANLKTAGKSILDGTRLADPADLQVTAADAETEAEAAKQLAEWAEKERDWKEREEELNRMITMSQTNSTEVQQQNQQLQAKLATLKSQLEQLQKQQQQHPADRVLASSVSPLAGGPSTSRQAAASSSSARGGNPFPHSQMLMPHTMPQPVFNMQALPRGSAIGQTHMAGRADELISGLSHLAGLGDSMASVAVTAATMPEVDEYGNQMQRTVRTRIERIAVTDDMDLEELARLGFQVVSVEGEDDGPIGAGAHIEEMEGGAGGAGDDGEEGEPLVEEAE